MFVTNEIAEYCPLSWRYAIPLLGVNFVSHCHQVKKAIAQKLNMLEFQVNAENLRRMSNPNNGFPHQERIAKALEVVRKENFRHSSTWRKFRDAL